MRACTRAYAREHVNACANACARERTPGIQYGFSIIGIGVRIDVTILATVHHVITLTIPIPVPVPIPVAVAVPDPISVAIAAATLVGPIRVSFSRPL